MATTDKLIIFDTTLRDGEQVNRIKSRINRLMLTVQRTISLLVLL